ncbi:hypothetical protein [Jiangella sp. DSM 45060]|nr:hypothetical protein [Jiangella sp. DSM 45060]
MQRRTSTGTLASHLPDLPLAVLGYLIRGTITDPGDGWTVRR